MELSTSSYLKLYIGCMFSGKTTSLLNEVSKYKVITKDIIVVNHKLDSVRWNCNTGFIKTHNKKIQEYDAVMVDNLSELRTGEFYVQYSNANIVVIDEGQFYKDLFSFISNELKTTNKLFIIGGLSGDYNMNPIGDIIKLIPLADEIVKLNAYCIYCKNSTLASFTKRITNSHEQLLVGKDDIYAPVCRKHHLSN